MFSGIAHLAVPADCATAQDDAEPPPVIDFIPVPDRWRIPFGDWTRYADAEPYSIGSEEYPFAGYQWWNPYRRNTLKGDYAFVGQEWFCALTVTSDTLAEWRRLPTPSGVSANRPDSDPFFGRGEQLFVNEQLLVAFEVFKGDAAYRPRDLELRITPAYSRNHLRAEERNLTDVDPRQGNTRDDRYHTFQEAFLEIHLADTSTFYDFVSTRVGLQGFNSDFRGFVFLDNEPGVRLFGTARSNRAQWNLAWFGNLEKDTNSALVKIDDRRPQDVWIANGFLQDFLAPGWVHELSFLWNDDDGGSFTDDNGFPVRPARVGTVEDRELDTFYLGWTSEGHAGPINVSSALYHVSGRDERNPIAGREQRVSARMAALELSRDFDWLRPKCSLFYASGDRDPTDGEATGFDAIFDNVNFAGGAFSFWGRQGIPLTGSAVVLTDRISLLPSLRTSKLHGQANHVNPGILILNAGLEAKVTQEVKLDANANWMRFAHTDALELVLNDDRIRAEIGWDLSVGAQIRPWLTDNLIVTSGIAFLLPARGFRDLYEDRTLYSAFVGVTLTW